MDSKWQEQLLALVARYGEACAQMAAERVSGRSEHPPANRSGAWAAIVSHAAARPMPAQPQREIAGSRAAEPAAARR